jgi:tetratricopeptide (TPR) repeat protein
MKPVWNLNCVDILTGKPEEALMRLNSYRKPFEKSDPGTFHFYKGIAHLASRMPELALEEFKKAEALVPESDGPGKRGSYCWEAVAQLELGNLPEVDKLYGEIDRLLPGFLRKTDVFIPYIRGRLALARKNFPDALKLLDKAVTSCLGEGFGVGIAEMNAFCLDGLASAYLEMGDADNALKNYEMITLLTYGRFAWGDLYARSFYNLGKIYEQKGLKNKAAENYERFIGLWKDCEPRFRPLVEDARKRLAALRSS